MRGRLAGWVAAGLLAAVVCLAAGCETKEQKEPNLPTPGVPPPPPDAMKSQKGPVKAKQP